MKKFLIFTGVASYIFLNSGVAQIDASFIITTAGRVQLIITDTLGRRYGKDPRIGVSYREIPGFFYSMGGTGTIDTTDDPDTLRIWNLGFPEDIDTPYTMKFRTSFIPDLGGGLFSGLAGMGQTRTKGFEYYFKGVLSSGQTLTYDGFYTTDSTRAEKFGKIIDGMIFRQDLDNCPKFGLITQTLLYQTLSTQLNSYDTHIAIPDSINAARDIRSFKHILDSVKIDTTKITSDGYWILNEDDSLLIAQLPVPQVLRHR
jgi:hypothetical protein